MEIFEKEYIEMRVNAMRMTQGTLQHLMTLSAGGLALYFGFIGKVDFVSSYSYVGIIVVWAWVVALCAAAAGHKLIGNMVISINSMHSATNEIERLNRSTDDLDERISSAIDKEKLLKEEKENLEKGIESFKATVSAFEQVFFPMQDKVSRLVSTSLWSFILGFISLGAGYTYWVFCP